MKSNRRMFIGGVSAAAVLGSVRVASAQKKYSDGASDTEIKLGHTGPYSGPASSYGQIGKTIDASSNATITGLLTWPAQASPPAEADERCQR